MLSEYATWLKFILKGFFFFFVTGFNLKQNSPNLKNMQYFRHGGKMK